MKTPEVQERSIYTDLRKHERITAKEGAVAAFLTPDNLYYTNVGEILDISIGGLAIKYISKNGGHQKDELKRVEVFGDRSPCYPLGVFRCRVAYDIPLEKDPWSSLKIRRCGLEFAGLPLEQTYKLRRFIRTYSN